MTLLLLLRVFRIVNIGCVDAHFVTKIFPYSLVTRSCGSAMANLEDGCTSKTTPFNEEVCSCTGENCNLANCDRLSVAWLFGTIAVTFTIQY